MVARVLTMSLCYNENHENTHSIYRYQSKLVKFNEIPQLQNLI